MQVALIQSFVPCQTKRIVTRCQCAILARSLFFRASYRNGHRGNRKALYVCAAVKKAAAKQIACSKTLVVRPGQEPAIERLCSDIIAFTKGRMGDRTAGIVTFEFSKDAYEPNVYHFWELYDNNVAMGRHNTTPEMKKFMESTKFLLERPIGMALYEYNGGKLGAVAVQGGPKGEGGLDDATGASGAAGGASYKQTSGAVDLTAMEEEDDRGLWGIKFKLPWFDNPKK